MAKPTARLLAGIAMTGVLAAALPGATFAARPHYLPYRGLETASGQIGMVLGQNQFLLTLNDGDALAINVTPHTKVLDEIPPGGTPGTPGTSTGTPSSTPAPAVTFASGDYAVVHYRFSPATGAVAAQITLSTSPIAHGKPHRLSGLVTEVGSGSFVLEGSGGASFTITILPSTRLFAQNSAITSSPSLAVGDFVTTLVRSGVGINDAVSVAYGNRPYGARTYGIFGTVTAVSGQELTVQMRNGATRVVNVLPTAQVTLNGQPSALASIGTGDTVHLTGSLFQNTFYADMVAAGSTVSQNG